MRSGESYIARTQGRLIIRGMPGPSQDPIEAKVNMARDVILALERAVRTRRTYTSDHARSVECTEELLAKFLEFFNNYAYMRLEITPEELRFEKRTLVKVPAHEPHLPFMLFKDGLREIRFHRGISRDEILEFLNVLETDPRELREMDEDLVSLLWSRDFASIDYVAVDEFDAVEAPPGVDPAMAPEIRQIATRIQDLSQRYVGEGVPSIHPAEDTHTAAPAVDLTAAAPPDLEALFGAEDPFARLRASIELDTVGSAIERAIEALYALPANVPAQEVEEMVTRIVSHYIQRHDYCGIGHLLRRLRPMCAQRPAVGRAYAKLSAELTAPDLADNLVEFLNRRYTGDEEGLRQFLVALANDSGPLVCRIYSRVASQRTRRVLREHLLRQGVKSVEAVRHLLLSGERVLSEVMDLLMELRPTGLVKELEEFLVHPSFTVRLQAITLLGRLEGLQRTRLLFGQLENPDKRVRMHVLKTLGQARDAGTAPFLIDWINNKDFVGRDADEKRAAFQALVAICGEGAVPVLEKIAAARPPLLGRQKHQETREAAIAVLKSMNSPAAEAAVRRISG